MIMKLKFDYGICTTKNLFLENKNVQTPLGF